MSDITATNLEALVSGDPSEIEVHLDQIEHNLSIDGTSVNIHCYCLSVDSNGRVQLRRLAEFMRNAIVDYAVPRSKLEKAKQRDMKYNSTTAVMALVEQARQTFTDLEKTGEGGELLLFLLTERILKLPQILCKMDLKTDARMHYHGADGVYADVREDGVLKLYWGESKIYKDATAAIKDCLASLAPFLTEPEHEEAERERDLVLLSDKADLSDARLTDALKCYFDKTSPKSKRVQYCGIALVGFDAKFYPRDEIKAIADEIRTAARAELESWKATIGKRLLEEKLDQFELEFFCIPIPSAESFRSAFLQALGIKK